jgi:hypothetical protein
MVMISNQTGFEAGLLCGIYPNHVGHLYSPGGERGPYPEVKHGYDNNKFNCKSKLFPNKPEWDEARWRLMLRRAALSGVPPLWVLVPDEPGDRDGTLCSWDRYAPEVRAFGFRLAFAVQDGMAFGDVPDDDCVLFLGGGDEWKDAAIKPWCSRFPGRVHVGRVNGMPRLLAAYHAGAVSVDGTGWFHKDNNKSGGQLAMLRKFLRETSANAQQAA